MSPLTDHNMLLGGGKTTRGNRIFLAAMVFRRAMRAEKGVKTRHRAVSADAFASITGERKMPATAWRKTQPTFCPVQNGERLHTRRGLTGGSTGLFNHQRHVERFTQGANKGFIMTDRFPGAVRELRHRFTVALYQFDDNIQRLHSGDIAAQPGANAKNEIDALPEMAVQHQRLVKIEAVGKHQRFAERIDTQPFIMRNGLLAPFYRVAGVVPQTLIGMGKRRPEIA
ncbi:hypothetical protein SODG_000478 [Sodalis praecaptivus]